jgi:hypothetical protein
VTNDASGEGKQPTPLKNEHMRGPNGDDDSTRRLFRMGPINDMNDGMKDKSQR